ncbi:hypothetical protein ASH02_08415 [Nocardioides sp. Soil796]|nr:hypothetical protein ASH02_08415 [Nocardioides sp. Soil796]
MWRRVAFPVVFLLLMALLAPASWAMTDRWAAWDPITGTSNDYSTTVRQQAPGFPAAGMRSDSRSNVQLPSGASTFLGTATPPGAKYGSSRNQAYVVLRPRADTATTPSTTTYTFEHPTPDTGWAFVLGDIDADLVRVRATDEDGNEVSAAETDSWFQGTFNYAGETDLPTWDAATGTLTGNAGAVDTSGASGWFEPDVRLTSLTFTYTRRAGFPVYQTWFVSRARPIGGTVTDQSVSGSCPITEVVLTLASPYGEQLASTSPAADGSYDFGEFATQDGYLVRLSAPATCAVIGSSQQTVSNRGNDGDPASRADFDVRAIIPQPLSGTVRDGAGSPVAGVAVTLTPPGGGTPITTTTSPDGTYLFDDCEIGIGYAVAVTVPAGYRPGPEGTERTGIEIDTSPVVDQDFVVLALPAVSGTVTGGGGTLGGVQVTLTPTGGGAPLTTSTRADGSYDLTRVPDGDYTLAIVAPDGYAGATSRPVTVNGTDLTNQDFALERSGALGGQVTRAGTPVPGVVVTVEGPGGTRVLTTDGEGRYFLDDLPPGTWTIAVTAPDGTRVDGPSTRSVEITAAGEIRGDQDFRLVADDDTATPTASPSPSESPTSNPTEPPSETPPDVPSGGELPDTGGVPAGWLVLGLGMVLAGLCLLLVTGGRRDHRDELS